MEEQIPRTRILIADDHALVREGTRQILEREPDFEVVGEAGDGASALALAATLQPDVIVLDLRLPRVNGIEATERLRGSHARVLIVSAYEDDEYVASAIQAGAAGYLPKTAPASRLVEAVRSVHGGHTVLDGSLAAGVVRMLREQPAPLTSRELEVLQRVAHGRRNKEIARDLAISLRTVEGHINSILLKLGVGSRTEAVLYAVSHHVVELGT